MRQYPISISVEQYSGFIESKRAMIGERNRAAGLIVNFINDQMEHSENDIRIFEAHELSEALNLDVQVVCGVLHDNGITVCK